MSEAIKGRLALRTSADALSGPDPYYNPAQPAPAYTERDVIELMVRAPACPEWFEPDMSGYGEVWAIPFSPTQPFHPILKQDSKYLKAVTIQWPRAYAIMVLEAK